MTPSEPSGPGGRLSEESGLLRLATAGSVDDGKSTLVGRLLHDTKSVLADQLAAVEQASRSRGLAETDLALLTDGLRAEREQGITIDVAYRYFATPRRRFILADTPGHVQYTRNMVTGASTADLAVVLVDVRNGVVTQTRRHAAVAALLRVPHVVLAVNKMDLVGYEEARFAEVADAFALVAKALGLPDVTAIPLSALRGDNVVEPSAHMDWYGGPTLLEHLESVEFGTEEAAAPPRFPVQYVLRPQTDAHRDYRGYAGRLVSGTLHTGAPVVVLPSGRRTTIAGIDLFGEEIPTAVAGQSVTVRLADDLDVSRGDLLVPVDVPAPRVVTEFTATVCHLADRPLAERDRVLVRHTTRVVKGLVVSIDDRLDIDDLSRKDRPGSLAINDIGLVTVRVAAPLAVDDYAADRATGSFLLVDEHDGATLAAGMVGDVLTAVAVGPGTADAEAAATGADDTEADDTEADDTERGAVEAGGENRGE